MRSSLHVYRLRAAINPIINALALFKDHSQKIHHQLERLEPRQLLNGISGTSGDDTFAVEYQNNAIHSIHLNGQPVSFSEPVTINAGAGNDELIIEFNNPRAAIYTPDSNTSGSGTIVQ